MPGFNQMNGAYNEQQGISWSTIAGYTLAGIGIAGGIRMAGRTAGKAIKGAGDVISEGWKAGAPGSKARKITEMSSDERQAHKLKRQGQRQRAEVNRYFGPDSAARTSPRKSSLNRRTSQPTGNYSNSRFRNAPSLNEGKTLLRNQARESKINALDGRATKREMRQEEIFNKTSRDVDDFLDGGNKRPPSDGSMSGINFWPMWH